MTGIHGVMTRALETVVCVVHWAAVKAAERSSGVVLEQTIAVWT